MTGLADAAHRIFAALKKRGRVVLTWLMCVTSVSAVLYIYTQEPVNAYTLFSAIASAVLIKLLGFLRAKRWGGVAYTAMLITVGIVSPMFVGSDWYDMAAFVRWFFSGAQAESTRASFMLALTPIMTFFLTSAFYYFTLIIYRAPMLALVSLIPFALAVKAVVSLPFAYAAVMASLNLFKFIAESRKGLFKDLSVSCGNPAAVYTDFAAAAALLALLLPKPSEAPFYEKFEEAVNMFSFGGSGETVYKGEYKTESGGIDELIKGESRLIYIINTPDPVYMKSQVFDLYNPASGNWLSMGDSVTGSKNWQETAGLLSFEKLGELIEKASDEINYDWYPFAADMPKLTERESYSVVYSQDFAAQYVLSPLRATEVSLSSVYGIEWCARSKAGEIFTNLNRELLPHNASYTVRYYSEDAFDKITESGFCDTSFDEYQNFITALCLSFDYDSDEYAAANMFYKEIKNAREYSETTAADVSPEIQALADNITEGLEYDYQKAEAIERYFHGNGFLYNLNFEPPEGSDTPEYFLFESKTGICSDFASAYTLLARAAGLTVRYAEGFVPQPSEESPDVYFINTDNAHAYPEVFIPGAGWMIYEPTPANLLGGNELNNDNTEIDYAAVFLTAAVFVFGVGLFVLMVMIAPKFMERVFRIRVKRIGGKKAVIMLYNRHIKNAEDRFGESLRAFTPEQTAEVTEKKTGLSLKPLSEPFTEACYGERHIDNNTFEKAYECYKAQAKAMRKKNKKRRDNI